MISSGGSISQDLVTELTNAIRTLYSSRLATARQINASFEVRCKEIDVSTLEPWGALVGEDSSRVVLIVGSSFTSALYICPGALVGGDSLIMVPHASVFVLSIRDYPGLVAMSWHVHPGSSTFGSIFVIEILDRRRS